MFFSTQTLAQKSDLEDRVSILEKKYQQVQRDLLSAKDENERLENELNSKESSALQVSPTDLTSTNLV